MRMRTGTGRKRAVMLYLRSGEGRNESRSLLRVKGIDSGPACENWMAREKKRAACLGMWTEKWRCRKCFHGARAESHQRPGKKGKVRILQVTRIYGGVSMNMTSGFRVDHPRCDLVEAMNSIAPPVVRSASMFFRGYHNIHDRVVVKWLLISASSVWKRESTTCVQDQATVAAATSSEPVVLQICNSCPTWGRLNPSPSPPRTSPTTSEWRWMSPR